ncbi:hypothetical protein [Actinosynnema sp. NPDC023587]|uniref:hypothetical protein n=1 Tax=Actinosynnema sp. NPDC023587 TaxID=3154695 RepID=UPI0033E16927
MSADTPITDQPATELQVGDRVHLDDQGGLDDYGTVVEAPTLMYADDPGPRVRVERLYVHTEDVTPLVSEVRRVPPGEEQEISLRPWLVTGEQICDDPEEYDHPHQVLVHESDLPEIIRTYLAANGMIPPGGWGTALPYLTAAKENEPRERKSHPWPHDDVANDFRNAVCGDGYGSPDTRMIGLAAPETARISEYEVDDVVHWQATYHSGSPWKPGDDTGSELLLHAVLRLRTGQWVSVEAWNDYTGWGCQDGSVVRIGDTEDEVVWRGLSDDGRRALGYAAALRGER